MKKKRFFDIIILFTIFPIIFPIFILIFILNILINGTPAFFKQTRIGYLNKKFTIYKFRTMPVINNSEIDNINKWSKILRNFSLDEIPEFYNVLIGDMSIVGPRPLLIEYLSLYNNEQIKRHNIKPGITGLAQISGRNSISWNKKFSLDIEYVNKNNFFIDLKIIFKTFTNLVFHSDINSGKKITMEKFKGDSEER